MVELQVSPVQRSRATATAWFAAFVLVESVILVATVTDLLPHLLPARLATQVGHNSESFALAILLSSTVLVLRLRHEHSGPVGRRWAPGVAAAAVGLFALGLLLDGLGGEPRLKTLNEPVFAAAILLPYCAIWPRRRAFAYSSLLVLVLTVVLFDTDVVRLQAECVVALILAPVGLDLVARWMLAPRLRQPVGAAYAWTAFLLLAPFVLMVLKPIELGPFLDAVVLYSARGNEAFWGLFLVHVLGLIAWAPRSARVHRGRRETAEVTSG